MDKKWFLERRTEDKVIIENSLRDLNEVEGVPKKEVTKVLDFLFEIGFLEEKKIK